MRIKLPIEFNFVLLCVQSELDNTAIEKIEQECTPLLDWDLVCEIALVQRVMPVFYKNIKAIIPQKVPDKTLARLKSLFFGNAVKNTYFCSVLLKILYILRENNIFALAFKGPVLAKDIYGSIEFRLFGDLDIIVSMTDALAAWDILISMGFKPTLNLDRSQRKKYLKSEDHIGFSKKSLCLELHWEITGMYLSKPIRLENIRSGLTQTTMDKQVVDNLSCENLLVYLCVHGTKHGWERLEQVCCIDRILRTKKIDWKKVEAIARTWKCRRMLALGLYLSRILMESPLPEHVQNKTDKNLPTFAHMAVYSILNAGADRKSPDITDRFSFFHIRIRDSLSDKLTYLFRLVFSSTDKEWRYYPVPAYLSFLHFFLRPYRLIKTKLYAKF